MEPTAWEVFKRVAVGFIVRRLLGAIGGIIAYIGFSDADVALIVGGILTFLANAVWSWYQTKWLARKKPEEMKDLNKAELT